MECSKVANLFRVAGLRQMAIMLLLIVRLLKKLQKLSFYS